MEASPKEKTINKEVEAKKKDEEREGHQKASLPTGNRRPATGDRRKAGETEAGNNNQARAGRGIHGLPKVSPSPTMPDPSTPCGHPWTSCGVVGPEWMDRSTIGVAV
jgi:hypothetical protein